MDIVIIREKISFDELKRITDLGFGDMVKGVADLGRDVIALGGELHADAEDLLLRDGSAQKDLWGFNIFPDYLDDKQIEYVSFINIRPTQGNMSMEVTDQALRDKIKIVIEKLVELTHE